MPGFYLSEKLFPSADFFPSDAALLEEESEEGSQLWEVLYEALGFHRATDEPTGYQLETLCQILMTPLQRVYDLVRERPGRAAGATMLDPDTVPAEGLAYLAQYVGARLRPNMSEAQRRAEIKQPSTWRRGQVPAIELVAKRELSEGPDSWIRIRPRFPGPGQIYIRTLLSQTPNPAREKQLLEEEGIPAWDLLDYDAIEGVSWDDIAASFGSWDELAGTFADWDAVADMLPDELP